MKSQNEIKETPEEKQHRLIIEKRIREMEKLRKERFKR